MSNNQLTEESRKIIQENERIRALRALLDRDGDRKDRFFALRLNRGDMDAYLVSAPLKWVAENIRHIAAMPAYKGNTYDAGQSLFQRAPDWSRQAKIVADIARKRYYKFPPLLVIAHQPWINDNKSDCWGVAKALKESVDVHIIDSKGAYGYLSVNGATRFYALDGQDHLMAIQGISELTSAGFLNEKDGKGKPLPDARIEREQIIDDIMRADKDLTREQVKKRLQSLMDEQIGIEIIPAIIVGEKRADAVARMQRIVADVNGAGGDANLSVHE